MVCVSHDDLNAPYCDRERGQHEELCKLLVENFKINLSLEDFFSSSEEEGETISYVCPLGVASVKDQDRLLIVTCNYEFAARNHEDRLGFAIAADSVTFHLIESA